MTLSCLLGGENATDRPMAKVQLIGANKEETFLYDSGAQVSLVGRTAFRKIPVNKRPEKTASKLSGGNNLKAGP